MLACGLDKEMEAWWEAQPFKIQAQLGRLGKRFETELLRLTTDEKLSIPKAAEILGVSYSACFNRLYGRPRQKDARNGTK